VTAFSIPFVSNLGFLAMRPPLPALEAGLRRRSDSFCSAHATVFEKTADASMHGEVEQGWI
jgi:hypothetical protein